MSTVKRFLKILILQDIPATIFIVVVEYFIIWLFNRAFLEVWLGGIIVNWKMVSIGILTGVAIVDFIKLFWPTKKLRTYAKRIGVPFEDVEKGWWDFKFRRRFKKEMFRWDKRTFEEHFELSKSL